MSSIYSDKRTVMTLDAGGTNFVFNAMRGGKSLLAPIKKAANGDQLERCLKNMIEGFEAVVAQLDHQPEAISFAFPGPADYPNGIIGDLGNLPAFRGGVALGPMLAHHFGIPVFIQNDGDLYAYGEALGGILPEINTALKEQGSTKCYKNLIGLTLGTGFGAGLVHDNVLIAGDNSIVAEVWNVSNAVSPERNAEEGVSTRAIINEYNRLSGNTASLMPKDVFDIAEGNKEGNKDAAREAFAIFGRHLGDAVANLINLFDGIVVIGGGLTGASSLYMPAVMQVIKGQFDNGQDRLVQKVYCLDNADEKEAFFHTQSHQITVPFTDKKVDYSPEQKIAIATSKLDASEAIAIGAYAYALSQLDQ
ncbi:MULTISPECIES: ROK family protein [unclassified Carboxylicivirga]|uniref:ROK family protein n=1 Tax=Carboxylicivirga TaxID=1628153 RepID=UPI003D328E64